jgi:thiamine pyrophosphate-dependent acetolactate synthase large subunit-like protein
MSVTPQTPSHVSQMTGAQAIVSSLLRHGITSGFGIPSIHNIALYEALRQTPQFSHWVVRHEQAAGFAADGFYRSSGKIAVVFASTGPGNLFTLVPLLESLQTETPVLLLGTNIASSLLGKKGGALHETPDQLEIFRPLTRFARRITQPDEISEVIDQAVAMFHGTMPGPAFIEIPHDLLLAPVDAGSSENKDPDRRTQTSSGIKVNDISQSISNSRKPVLLIGAGANGSTNEIRDLAETLQCPVFTTTSGKGIFPGDHPLSLGCISRLGAVQETLDQSDLLISFGTRLTEFDTGRFGLRLPHSHIHIVVDVRYAGNRMPSTLVVGAIHVIIQSLVQSTQKRQPWCDIAAVKQSEEQRLEALHQESYAALNLLRSSMDRKDVLINDQSILSYWASAFFAVLEPNTFLYPYGSGTLGYALPAAIGVACANRQSGQGHKIICIAGDGGFQYTQHELATLAQYQLAVKILLVNDQSYGVIGFLQRSMFGQTHEVALKNPDFCRMVEAYGIPATRATSLAELKEKMPAWLNAPGPALLEWRTQLKAPWEVGAIPRPTGVGPKTT